MYLKRNDSLKMSNDRIWVIRKDINLLPCKFHLLFKVEHCLGFKLNIKLRFNKSNTLEILEKKYYIFLLKMF